MICPSYAFQRIVKQIRAKKVFNNSEEKWGNVG